MTSTFPRVILTVVLAALAGGVVGCSGADNPKVAEVPETKITPDTAPPQVPSRKAQTPYGASKKYQDSMDKINKGP